ncbi:MAG: hypothetical protein JWM07_886 [Candidatus Saccharibacteria bacterium]|nr:hypothetical protein [Candidatus Saccharibacteria bacterium]
MNEAWNVGLQSNFLRVDEQTLRADVLRNDASDKLPVNAEHLEQILKLGRFTILEGIEDFYEKTQAANPTLTVERPSIFTAHLGTTAQTDGRKSRVFTERGYDNGGIITSIDEIKAPFHGHWNAVKAAGFVPEIRRTSGKEDGGSWLLLRKPTLANVITDWVYYYESPEAIAVRNSMVAGIENDSFEVQHERLSVYEELGKRAIEAAVAYDNTPARAYQHVGLELAVGILSTFVDETNPDRLDMAIDDAYQYAKGSKHVDDSVVLAIENATW